MLDIYVREWTVWDSLSRRLIPGPGQIAGRRLIECCLCKLTIKPFPVGGEKLPNVVDGGERILMD